MRKIEIEISEESMRPSLFGLGVCELEPSGTGTLKIEANRSAVLTELRLLGPASVVTKVLITAIIIAGMPLCNAGETPLGLFETGFNLRDYPIWVGQTIRVELTNTSREKVCISGGVLAFELRPDLMEQVISQLSTLGTFKS